MQKLKKNKNAAHNMIAELLVLDLPTFSIIRYHTLQLRSTIIRVFHKEGSTGQRSRILPNITHIIRLKRHKH